MTPPHPDDLAAPPAATLADGDVTGAPNAPADSKRDQILAGAREVFRARGLDGASMEGVARAAGVSKGTLYVYFDSKEHLFAELVRTDLRAAAEQHAVLDRRNPDVRAVLRTYGVKYIGLVIEPEHIAMLRMVIAASQKLPELGRVFFEAGPGYGAARLAAFLEERTRAGQLRVNDALLAAVQFHEMCQGPIVKPCFFSAPSDTSPAHIERIVDAALDVFLRFYEA